MEAPRPTLVGQIVDHLKNLRFPWLVAVIVILFIINVGLIDPIPFVDEILLGLIAAVLASLRKRGRDERTIEGDAGPHITQAGPNGRR